MLHRHSVAVQSQAADMVAAAEELVEVRICIQKLQFDLLIFFFFTLNQK